MLNKLIAQMLPHMPRKMVWIFSQRYIAGETMEEGLLAAKILNEQNMDVTIDLLGEFIQTLEEAEENRTQYLQIIRRFTDEGVRGNFSLKPTMFGLLIDFETCYRYIYEIVDLAAQKNSFVRIDMEDSQCVDMEIELFRRLRQYFPENVGLVLQSYLRRTRRDLENLTDLNSEENPLNFRLCKGIYIEPEDISFKDYQEIRDQFVGDLDFIFQQRMAVGIATHDKFLVEQAYRLIEKYQVPRERYEFQMLFGVTPELRRSIIEKGHRMRVYVPFGKHWFNYSTRRLKENPKVAGHIIRALFVRG